MDAGMVGAKIASGVVAPLVRKLFVTEGPGAGLAGRPVRVSGLVSFRGEKRTLGRKELQRIADELVRRAVRELGPHEAPDQDEARRVARWLGRALHALGDIGLTDLEAVQLGHTDFGRALHAQAALQRDVLEFNEAEEALYHRVLDTACLHILHFFTQRSTFVARTLVEQSRTLAELVTLVDVLIERIPARSAQDAEFEQGYARYVANRHCTLTIYGIDMQQASEWPLDTAYLSLEAIAPREHRGDALGATDDTAWAPQTAGPQPVEQALAGHHRVLLRGVAGSGKTTLVQWLAVKTARQTELTGRMAHLIGRVPFVLPLRSLTREGGTLPTPESFLSAVGCPLAGSQPPGWADRVLAAGRGLLLIDGVDEVPEDERARTRRWLRDLLAAFEDNLVLVTSRPSAVREDWLDAEDFTELVLSPMRPADVDVFIDRWHTAAEAREELAASLRTAVRTKSELTRLATNPLLCGLICALHRERHGFLPRGRKALYDAALSMLLERRDRERAVHEHRQAIELDEESQVELLQKLAYWLIRNGRSELADADAIGLLERVLPSMSYAAEQGTAEQIHRHLLVRSGLLREPAPGSVDFVHRTFQDYLGAKAAVEERDFGVLVQHAHLDQWEDVLRMAVAHARPDERAQLLGSLVRRGDDEPDHRTRLHLLAMACLEHATKLDPAVRTAVEQRARALVPPRSIDEAKALAEVGPVVLELLPGPDELDAEEAQATVHAAAQIGTRAALPVLARFRDHEAPAVLDQLGNHWDRFETSTYAYEIVRWLVQRPEPLITVRTREEMIAWSALGGSEQVRFTGDFSPEQILDAVPAGKVRRLVLARNPGLTDVGFLASLPTLREVHFFDCPQLRDLSGLDALPLEGLALEQVPQLETLGGLGQLRALHLNAEVPFPGWQALRAAGGLTYLRTLPQTTALSGLAHFPQLSALHLGPGSTTRLGDYRPLGHADWETLAQLRELGRLTIGAVQLARSTDMAQPLHGVEQLVLRDMLLLDEETRPAALPDPAVFPRLTRLMLFEPPDGLDLSPLAGLPGLRSLHLSRPEGHLDTSVLPDHVEVTRFPRRRRT
ncbi:NACHT domain-containing protein [Streptomyces cacaoi]|uniref:ATP-binding protein n=2 Tax=Streptomyces cacaoi TaxID=1898 RepID=A0A4Y3R7W7_STRCI|nr:NACHT domain-containing protein [Streptomyces cacaoi]GEB53664.1 ATP-binding protein [Streptomyces cacaoi]